MKPKSAIRNLLTALGGSLLTLSSASAATLFWSGDGTTLGGAGTWDTTNARWGSLVAGPYSSIWDNADLDTAVFTWIAGTVTLDDDITIGGLTFNTTAYTVNALTNSKTLTLGATDNRVLLNNVAASIITGAIGGSGNLILDSSNKATAGTLTLNNTGTGWSGTTTVNAGTTLAVGVTSNALASTSAINVNGGVIAFTKNGTIGDQISDTAAITFTGGGTLQQTNNTAGPHTETVGDVTIASGQANIGLTNGASSGGVVFTLGDLTRSINTAAASFFVANATQTSLRVSGAADTTSGQIIGTWATFGTSAAVQSDYAIYTGGNGTLAGANIAGTAENTWASGTDVTLNSGSAVSLTGNRTLNSLKFIGSTSTLTLGDFNLETYGVLWGGANANKNILGTGTGILTTPTGGGNLFLTVGQNVAHVVSANIGDNGGAVTLVKGGSNGTASVLELSGTNTYSGGTVINAGILRITADANLGDAAGDIIFNGNATLNMNTATALTFGAGRTVTINEGAAAVMTSGNAGKTFNGVLEGTGSLWVNSTTSFAFMNTANTFTGTLTTSTGGATSYGLDLASIGDGGLINIGNGGTAGTLRWFGSSGSTTTLASRQIALSGTTGGATIVALGSTAADNLIINKDLLVTGVGNKALTLAGSNAGTNTFAGSITDGTNGAGSVIGVTKTEGGIWALRGTNTYSGITNLVASGTTGRLIFQGAQSLSPNTTIAFNQNSSNVQSISLLDDGAGTLDFSRPITFTGANTTQVMNIFVGNNNTANGGSSAGTTTGSVIQVGDITWNNATQAANTTRTFNLTGANGYSMLTGDFILPNLSTRTAGGTWTNALNPTTASLTIGGDITMASGNNVNGGIPVLQLGGTAAGNAVNGSINDAADVGTTLRPLSVTKTGTSDWTLHGTSTYSGTTAITGGTLISGVASQAFGTNLNGISVGGSGTLRLLNNNSVSFTNGTSAYNIANTASGATLDVDRVSGTGSNTITIGDLPTTSTAATWVLNITGANGVSLSAGTLSTPTTASATTHAINNTIAGGGGLTLAGIAGGGTTTGTLVFSGNGDTTVTGAITQAGSAQALTKNGNGTLLLNGTNTYTGDTNVNGGTLGGTGTIAGNVTVAAAGSLAPGASAGTLTINGNLTISAMAGGAGLLKYELDTLAASDKIVLPTTGVLDIGTGVLGLGDLELTNHGGLQNGTYKLIETTQPIIGTLAGDTNGTLGSATIDLQISGDGTDLELVVSGLGAGDPYDTWSGSLPFDGDANGDGVSNGLAFLLGAAGPNANAIGLLPTVSESGGGLVMTFSMLDAASRGTSSLAIEHSSDLGITDAWTTAAVPDSSGGPTSGVTFVVSGSGTLNVTATIGSGESALGKLFGRLRAVKP